MCVLPHRALKKIYVNVFLCCLTLKIEKGNIAGMEYQGAWNVLLPCGQVRTSGFWYYQMLDYSNMKQSTFLAQGVSCPSDLTPNKNSTDTPVFKLSMLYNNYFGMKYSGFNQNEFKKPGAIRNPSRCGMIIDGNIDSSSAQSRGMNWLVVWGM